MPRVSIITATKDRPAELREALSSALAQDFADFELIVADDGSGTDATARVVESLHDARIRLVALATSRGPAGARNAALRAAEGPLAAILDDDDWMLPGRLRRSVARFDEDPGLLLVAGAFLAVDAENRPLATVRPPTGEARLRSILPRHNPVCHSTVMVKTGALRAAGGYREALRYAHDYDMVLRVMEQGRIRMLEEPLARYRFHAKNISTKRCLLQGAFAKVVQECAARRRRGEPERLEELVAAIEEEPAPSGAARAEARVHYQIGEWMFREGRAKEARPHLLRALRNEPFRPLSLGLYLASFTPAWVRRLLAPVVRPLVAARYASWR